MPPETMHTPLTTLLTGHELAQRWGRSETVISLSAAVGVGPRYVKIAGTVRYPLEEVQRFERTYATEAISPKTQTAPDAAICG